MNIKIVIGACILSLVAAVLSCIESSMGLYTIITFIHDLQPQGNDLMKLENSAQLYKTRLSFGIIVSCAQILILIYILKIKHFGDRQGTTK